MPLWKRSSPEEQERRLQAQQEMEASLRSLEAGGLPIQAQRRLREETEAGHKLFSSDLSTKEFALTLDTGYQPLTQVTGSSIYHVGWQYTLSYPRVTASYELTTVTNAHMHAAQLALGRLEQEAALLKAHGVIGVRFSLRNYEWGSDLVEYTAIGTAIRLPNAPSLPRPFLSDSQVRNSGHCSRQDICRSASQWATAPIASPPAGCSVRCFVAGIILRSLTTHRLSILLATWP